MKIKELPMSERPYEKMELYGATNLSNSELIAIIIKTGTKGESSVAIAQRILALGKETKSKDLKFLQEFSIQDFMAIKGIGRVKAIQLKAVCELMKRMSMPIDTKNVKITNSKEVANLFIPILRYEKREVVKLILLNNKNIMQKIVDISLGGTNFSYIEPKDILREAIKLGAPRIILVHNHPSR